MTQGRATERRRPTGKKYLPWSKYDELVSVLGRVVRTGDWRQQRDALAVVLGLHGLRVSEVCGLQIGDLDVSDRTIDVATLKHGVDRVVGLGRGVCEAILRWRDGADAQPLLFTVLGRPVNSNCLREAFHELWAVVSPKEYKDGRKSHYRFHSLRHTFAMRTLHNTNNATIVAGRLGHRSVKTTDVYTLAYGQLSNEQIERIGVKIPEVPALDVEPAVRLQLFAG